MNSFKYLYSELLDLLLKWSKDKSITPDQKLKIKGIVLFE